MSSPERLISPSNDLDDSFSDGDVTSDVEAELYSQIYFLDSSHNYQLKEAQNPREVINESEISRDKPKIKNRPCEREDQLDERTVKKDSDNWPIIGNSSRSRSASKAKTVGCFNTFSPLDKNLRVKVMTDSSECEVVMEVLPVFSKPVKKVPIVQLTSSSDEELSDSDSKKSKIDENFTLNVIRSPVSEIDISEPSTSGSQSTTLIKSPNLTGSSKSIDFIKKYSESRMKNNEIDENVIKTPRTFSAELRQDGSLSISKELWSINAKDKFKSSFRETEYYREKSRLNRIICHNCKEAGHLSKHCKKPKRLASCFLCGNEGHTGDFCPNPACSRCQRIGHTPNHCLWGSDNLKYNCSICQSRAHLREECPDIWRRYYLTTKAEEINPSLTVINPKKFCCNCGQEGHVSQDCTKKTMDNYLFITSSFICSYSNPNEYVDNFKQKARLKEDKVRNSLFEKKSDLTNLANEKYQRNLEGGFDSQYKRSRTQSDDPRNYDNYAGRKNVRQTPRRFNNVKRKAEVTPKGKANSSKRKCPDAAAVSKNLKKRKRKKKKPKNEQQSKEKLSEELANYEKKWKKTQKRLKRKNKKLKAAVNDESLAKKQKN